MLNKKELISAFQKLADEHLVPGKREDDKRRVYWIIIDDVRIENLNKFIKKHFIETERSAGWTFKQVTSNYIDAASYFTDHELSLMFYTCFSYKTVYYIQHKYKSLSIDYWDSKTKFNNYNYYNDTNYLAIDWDLDVMPATPNNYYIPQHFDITNADLWELIDHMDKALWKARSIYVKLYDYKEWILKSIEEYKNLINSVDDFKENVDNGFLWCSYWLLFLMLWSCISCFIFDRLSDISGRIWEISIYLLIICIILFAFSIIKWAITLFKNSDNYNFEKAKKFFKSKLLESWAFLEDCYFSHESDKRLLKMEEYNKQFHNGWEIIIENGNKFSMNKNNKDLPHYKDLRDAYKKAKAQIEEWWKVAWWRSVFYEYNDKLWWDYDINIAKEKFSWDDEL